MQTELDAHEAEIVDLEKFIPPVALDTLKDAKDIVKTKQAICDAINDSGNCDDLHGLAKGMCAFKKMFNPKKTSLRHTSEGSKDSLWREASTKATNEKKGGRS